MFDLGTLGGTTSWANSINTSGQIAGGSHAPPDERWHAYLRDEGVMTDLGTLGGSRSVAYNLNDAGQVVGWADLTGNITFHAVLWNNGVITDLGTLSGPSVASGINNSGQIVGYSYTAAGRQHAFIYSGGVMQDLNDLIPVDSGWELNYGSGITDDGKIIGWGLINGQTHAFLLTLSPSLMINNLINLVLSFNLPHGIENSLIAKLQDAQDFLDAGNTTEACNQLTAFINGVNAQAGNKLTMDQANQLLSGANQIRAVLGCQ
jgi:probable HAF family extracellular repeat protein